MKAIGGYFGLECGQTPLYYNDGLYVNSCRNALRYLIRSLGIKKINIPVFTCIAVEETLKKEKCEIKKYNIGKDLFPVQDIPQNEFVVYNNYFGVTGEKVMEMSRVYPNLIIDNAQAFYSKQVGRGSIYSLRKFFGVPDGGILRGKNLPGLELERGSSFEVMSHLLIRKDIGAELGYKYFLKDEEIIDEYELEKISNLTESLLGNIDYEFVKKRRVDNFNFIKSNLETLFPFYMDAEEDVPLIFPLLVENGGDLRSRLIQKKIFCAQYWPNVLTDDKANSFEMDLAKNIISIPIDQRYGLEDMKLIIKILNR